ncbi:MAG: carboxypeptidase regulatory-like domain-containing protein [Opitutaceae bacterium]|nr:carboxypeptidase regulatory-like domain-containing protein [Opitutaceae bacterium]
MTTPLRARLVLLAAFAAALAAPAARSAPATGSIEGRVYNRATGANLELARVTVEGTALEGFTDADGQFRLGGVPAGPQRVRIFYTGLGTTTHPLTVAAGATTTHDFALAAAGRADPAPGPGAPIKLDAFVVGDSREMSGTAIAINEQRFAPNMKNVVSVDEFGDSPDGNVAEFLKFLPGVTMNSAREISLDGVPSAYVPVTIGGFSVASPIGSGGDGGTGRTNSMDVFTTSNLSRIEVSFSPTPESEGAALAGSVNLVPRSAFERTRPTFNASAYVSLLNNGRDFHRGSSFRKIHPGLDFSWVVPVNKRFGFTLSGGGSVRQTDNPTVQNVWRGGGTATNGAAYLNTPTGQPYLSSHVVQATGRKAARDSLATTLDFKLTPRDRLAFGLQYSSFDVVLDHITLTYDVGRVLAGQFAIDNVRGAAGQGFVQQGTTSSLRENWSYLPSLTWRHDGPVWRAEAGAAYARARNRTRNIQDGLFATTTARRGNVTVSFEDVGYMGPARITVADGTTGAILDPFSVGNYVVTQATGLMRATDDTRRSVYANARRDFLWRVPFALKAGLDLRQIERDGRGFGATYPYLGRDGVASTTTAGSDDLALPFANPTHGQRIFVNGNPRIHGISSAALAAHFRANPAQFGAPNANTLYRSEVSFSNIAEEIVSSAYLRGDLALLNNRLKLVGGIRAEQTHIDAAGPLNDPTRNFRRDAQGRVIDGDPARAGVQPVLIVPAADALGVSQLTYLDRGGHAEKEYLRLFPSLNASYNLRENLVARAAIYTSIGRPDFSQFSGGVTLPDTELLPSNTNRITVNNTGIKPWRARTVNVRLEYYFEGIGQLSVGAFRREYRDFFAAAVFRPDAEFLANYGLDSETYGDFDVATQRNLTERVRSQGVTANYKQALTFLPPWARGVQVFGNISAQRTLGDATANFAGFIPRSASWGASLTRQRVTLHLNWNYRGRARRGAVATGTSIEPNTYQWGNTRRVTDLVAEYRVWKRIAVFANLRNLTHTADELEIAGPSTPVAARLRSVAADQGSLWTIGVKGSF